MEEEELGAIDLDPELVALVESVRALRVGLIFASAIMFLLGLALGALSVSSIMQFLAR